MLEKLRRFFMKQRQNEMDEKYISVSENEINEELQRIIGELERIAEEISKVLKIKYSRIFENQGKKNLRIWICRDIDGDEIDDITAEKCLEKEYRSQIAINYDGPEFDNDFYAAIELWYYFGGYFKGSGTLYDLSKNDLENDIEETLKTLLR
ncbi:hypothetical protein ACTSEZ_07520 [Metabacillus sp. JX24]|uniref:hypothetical protein n=1 Tax=Metabacillus sp. JX24 TaxID=3240759 RepID=UPI003510CD3A